MLKHVSDFDEFKLHYYPEEVHRSFCYCYIPHIIYSQQYSYMILLIQYLIMLCVRVLEWTIVSNDLGFAKKMDLPETPDLFQFHKVKLF